MKWIEKYYIIFVLLVIYFFFKFFMYEYPLALVNARRPSIAIEQEDNLERQNVRRPHRNVMPDEISIKNEKADNSVSSAGTAFAIDKKGNWVTARHVVEDCKQIFVGVKEKGLFKQPLYYLNINNREKVPAAKAIVKSVNLNADLAIISTDIKMKNSLEINEKYEAFKRAYAVGFPSNRPGEITTEYIGEVTAKIPFGRNLIKQDVIAWSIIRKNPLNVNLQGISGGPMFNQQGDIIGVNMASSIRSIRRGRIFTSDIQTLKDFLLQNNILYSIKSEKIKKTFTDSNFINNANQLRKSYLVSRVVCFY